MELPHLLEMPNELVTWSSADAMEVKLDVEEKEAVGYDAKQQPDQERVAGGESSASLLSLCNL